jgi:hypothetical protein
MAMSDLLACEHCLHWHNTATICGTPITEDICVGDGPYDRVGRFYRSIVVGVCQCTEANAGCSPEPDL